LALERGSAVWRCAAGPGGVRLTVTVPSVHIHAAVVVDAG
jgi:hypothetical protein